MRYVLFRPLKWLAGAPLADTILGDLEEGVARRQSQGRIRARLWFWRTALGILLFIGVRRIREALAAFWRTGAGMIGSAGDLQHALRSLWRRPGFTAASIALLALGIGANTGVFSIVYGVVLRPLPYHEPERLVYLWGDSGTSRGNRHSILTGSHVREIARSNTFLESYAVTMPWDTTLEGYVDLLRETGAERLRGALVTSNFFDVLGVRATVGRLFTAADHEAEPVAVISHALWRRHFEASPAVAGSRIRVAPGSSPRDQPPVTIIGVLPEDVQFTYPRETEIYLLLPWTRIRDSRALEYTMIGRLRPGVSAVQAQTELVTLNRQVASRYDNIPPDRMAAFLARQGGMVEPMQQHVSAEVRPGLLLLLAVAGLVLVIACVNLGLLSAARTVDRTAELAMRAALGAGQTRLVRLLLAEALLLASSGGLLGAVIAATAVPAAARALPAIVPRAEQIALNAPVLAFTAIVTLITAVVSTVAPAVLAMRRDLLVSIRRGANTTSGSMSRFWRSAVLAGQTAVVVVLVIGSGLLIHSFWKLQQVDVGFSPGELLTFEVRLTSPKYRSLVDVAAFERALLQQVRELPGVEEATLTTAVPMRGVDFVYVIGPPSGPVQRGHMRAVGHEYFRMMGVPLRSGRLFTPADSATSPPVMIVSESYGRLHFGAEDPVGRVLQVGEQLVEIVGVVGDVRYAEVAREAAPAFYRPRAQAPVRLICLLVKPQRGMQRTLSDALRATVRSVDPEQPVDTVTSVSAIVDGSLADRRFYACATGAFSAIAVALAVAGLYGAVSRVVSERRRELAIRAAIGASAGRLCRHVMTYGLIPTVIGLAAGLGAALAGSRLLTAFLFDISPTDPATFAATAALVLAAACVACAQPALRVLRFCPTDALRE